MIEAFGVLLTRMYGNYYTLISYRFLELFKNYAGPEGESIVSHLLTEAGHVCAFNTFGGIMQSNEWNGLIRPMIKTKEDWVYGIVAVINALGWGIWEVVELVPNEKLVLKITGSYESNMYLKAYGVSEQPISYFALGGTAGIMNLIYNTEITESVISFDEEQYDKTFKTVNTFTTKQIKCRAMGDDYDLFEITSK